jgi:hypothetical protein
METSESGSKPSDNIIQNPTGEVYEFPLIRCLQTEELRTRRLYLQKKKCAIDGI